MASEKRNPARGEAAGLGKIDRLGGLIKTENTAKSRSCASIAIFDAGTVVAIVAGMDAARAYLMGAAQ